MYSKKRFVSELKEVLQDPYDQQKVVAWADQMYCDYDGEFSLELLDVLDSLSAMSLGEEYEYTQQELQMLVEKLENNEDNALRNFRNIVRKKYGLQELSD